jgi:group II intron reverse transcriptase/maturase
MTSVKSSTKLKEVAERAERDPDGRFFALAYLIDLETLKTSFGRIKKKAAPGVDGVTKEAYAGDLEANLQDLHERLRTGKYRHQPIKRVHIPKGRGKTRPIGISTIEDKIVQGALQIVLEPVFENTFLECSMGFRRGRSQHEALKAVNRKAQANVMNWVLEIDVMSFFDSIDRKMLMEMLQVRVPDGSIKRLVGKCLRVGVLEGEEWSWPDEGTTQGSRISPLLGNIYLHYVLDLWFEKTVKPRLRGRATLVRFADDAIIGFEHREDAERVLRVLGKRLEKFNLKLHPEKTRLVDFRRPPKGARRKPSPGTFDFLGFTAYWRRSRQGGWNFTLKTRRASRGKFLREIYDWCRRHLHLSVKEQHDALVSRVRGHFQYFGVNGNTKALATVRHWVLRTWKKWLCRRSQRSRLNWERFRDLVRDFPLPGDRVYVQLWE